MKPKPAVTHRNHSMALRAGVITGGAVLALTTVPAAAFADPAAPATAPPATAAPNTAAPNTSTQTKNALANRTVFLDPGHQGSAAGHDLRKQVPNGRGGTKDCQTTGATGVNNVAEHTVNWDVVQLVKAGLESQGAKVVLSRPDDTGWGGCVDERAAAANAAKADIAVSVHADSTSATADPAKKGFHVIVPELPVPDIVVNRVASTTGRAASTQMRDSFKAAGFPTANYAGVVDGLQTRSDVAAVNLTRVPEVFVEMGNLANPQEAAALGARPGQIKYAVALLDGIIKYLLANPASTALSPSLPAGSQDTATAEVPAAPTATSGVDLTGVQSILPLIQKIAATRDPSAIRAVLQTQGQDASAKILKSILSVVYTAFGGKLPI